MWRDCVYNKSTQVENCKDIIEMVYILEHCKYYIISRTSQIQTTLGNDRYYNSFHHLTPTLNHIRHLSSYKNKFQLVGLKNYMYVSYLFFHFDIDINNNKTLDIQIYINIFFNIQLLLGTT